MSIDDLGFERALGQLLALAGRSTRVGGANLPARLEQVVDAATDVLRVRSVGLMLLDEDDRPRVAAATDGAAAALEAAQVRHQVGPGIDCMRRGAEVVVPDLLAVDDYAALVAELEDPPVRAVLASPVRVGGSVIGNFNALAPAPYDWTRTQVRANTAYAAMIGLALGLSASAVGANEALLRLRDQARLSGGTIEIGEAE